ncbi:MAG: stage III sporulation protein AB [Bacillota bacterium]
MLRILGALFILVGTGGLGHLMAGGLAEHAANLRRLVAALQHLESEIVFASLPLAQALHRTARTIGGEVGKFMEAVAASLAQNDGKTSALVWKETLAAYGPELLLAPAEMEILAALGAALGGSDREDQAKHLALARASLQRYADEAREKAEKGKRIWYYLGFSAGAFLILVFY